MMFKALRRWLTNTKHRICEWMEKEDIEMKKWREEDPYTYYDHVFNQRKL